MTTPRVQARWLGADWKFWEKKLISNDPDDPYLWRLTMVRTPWFSVKLHKIMRSDNDRWMHDHPWNWCSIMLRGSYVEHRPTSRKTHGVGSIRLRKATSPHRLELVSDSVWTLFITTGRGRVWGYHTPEGWAPWMELSEGTVTLL